MKPHDEVTLFIRKANEDLVILKKHIDDTEVSDSIWGFHAQQAAEKYLKAVLIKEKILFSKTHDLTVLVELLLSHVTPLPFDQSELEELNPYAVLMRYDDLIEEPLNRSVGLILILKIQKWAIDHTHFKN